MENRIVIQTKTTADDYKALIFFNMFLKKKAALYLMIAVAVLSLGAIIGRITGMIPMADWYFIVCIAYWGLLVLNYFVFRSAVRRFLASDKLVINSERTMTIDETGITVDAKQEEGFAVYKWDKLYTAYGTKKYYFLYINTAMALILSKRDFRAEDIPVLENLIRDNMGSKFKKR